jgi:hypothetical protein
MSRIVTLALGVTLACPVFAVTRNVAAGNNSNVNVQTAVNASVSGDIVLLGSGSHYFTGEVTLPTGKTGVIIRGASGAIIRKASNSNISAFRVDGNGYRFDNVEIDGGTKPGNGALVYGDSNTFTNCRFHHCGNSGILFHFSNLNTVTGGAYNNNNGVAISQWGSSDNDILSLTASSNGLEGLTIDGGSHNCFVQYVTMSSNRGGVGNVGIDFSNGSLVYNSTFNGHTNRSGVTFQNNDGPCNGPRIQNCTLNNNRQYGIHVRPTVTNYSFTGNTTTGNTLGTVYFGP